METVQFEVTPAVLMSGIYKLTLHIRRNNLIGDILQFINTNFKLRKILSKADCEECATRKLFKTKMPPLPRDFAANDNYLVNYQDFLEELFEALKRNLYLWITDNLTFLNKYPQVSSHIQFNNFCCVSSDATIEDWFRSYNDVNEIPADWCIFETITKYCMKDCIFEYFAKYDSEVYPMEILRSDEDDMISLYWWHLCKGPLYARNYQRYYSHDRTNIQNNYQSSESLLLYYCFLNAEVGTIKYFWSNMSDLDKKEALTVAGINSLTASFILDDISIIIFFWWRLVEFTFDNENDFQESLVCFLEKIRVKQSGYLFNINASLKSDFLNLLEISIDALSDIPVDLFKFIVRVPGPFCENYKRILKKIWSNQDSSWSTEFLLADAFIGGHPEPVSFIMSELFNFKERSMVWAIIIEELSDDCSLSIVKKALHNVAHLKSTTNNERRSLDINITNIINRMQLRHDDDFGPEDI